jgi:hypothetical protein
MNRLVQAYPGTAEYDQRRMDATAEDFGHIVDFLAAALYVGDERLFTDFTDWTTAVLDARAVPAAALAAGLRLVRDQLRDYPTATGFLGAGLARL